MIESSKKINTQRLAKMAMMLAVALLMSFIPTPPIFPAFDFIRYEWSDIPLLIGAFAFGAPAGLLIAFLTILLNALMGGAESSFYGAIMHFIAIGTYILVAGLIYRKAKSRKGAIIGLASGTVAMTAVMIPANLYVTPYFMSVVLGIPMTIKDIMPLLLPAIVPINLIKGVASAALTFLLYKRVSPFLHR